MTDFIIKYKDAGGEITERRISNVQSSGQDFIDAFCHLRNGRRSFNVTNIIYVINAETGEQIDNLRAAFGLPISDDGRQSLSVLTWPIISAIKGLKFFSMDIRGFAKRERIHIVKYIQEVAPAYEYSEEEIDEWLIKLRVGDLSIFRDGDRSEYEAHIAAIPISEKKKCREVAILIARGSGRKRIDTGLVERINYEFL